MVNPLVFRIWCVVFSVKTTELLKCHVKHKMQNTRLRYLSNLYLAWRI